jgi:hypothetical protein
MKGDPDSPRPFDILDWKATVAEAAVTAVEMQKVVASTEHLLSSADLERQLTQILETADHLENDVVDDIIDRAFLRGVALIIVFFVVLTIYRWLIRRVAPDPVEERKPGA